MVIFNSYVKLPEGTLDLWSVFERVFWRLLFFLELLRISARPAPKKLLEPSGQFTSSSISKNVPCFPLVFHEAMDILGVDRVPRIKLLSDESPSIRETSAGLLHALVAGDWWRFSNWTWVSIRISSTNFRNCPLPRVMECGRELVNCLSEWPLTYKMSRQLGFTPGTFRNAQNSLGPQLFFHICFHPNEVDMAKTWCPSPVAVEFGPAARRSSCEQIQEQVAVVQWWIDKDARAVLLIG